MRLQIPFASSAAFLYFPSPLPDIIQKGHRHLFEHRVASILCGPGADENEIMHIITRKRLNEFAAKHPSTKSGLEHWYRTLKPTAVHSFAELRAYFPSADQVGKLTVFNIGGNSARLIAAIHYNRQKVYIRAVLTHDEYDKSKWKE